MYTTTTSLCLGNGNVFFCMLCCVLQPATLSVTKTAKDANSGDCVGTSNNPCQLAPGVTKFSYTLTGTVKNSGQNNNGDIGFKSITLRDTLPSGFELDQLGATCDATKAGSKSLLIETLL